MGHMKELLDTIFDIHEDLENGEWRIAKDKLDDLKNKIEADRTEKEIAATTVEFNNEKYSRTRPSVVIMDEYSFKKKKGILYTSYFSRLKDGIGKKYAISNYYPKGCDKYLDGHLKHLAPNMRTMSLYKTGKVSFDQLALEYRQDIKRCSYKVWSDITTITDKLDRGEDVTVYCYEKDKPCHRFIFGEIMSDIGYEVKEIV